MPGIYVRTTSQFDRIQQGQVPVLTVPGSYWLCHRNNVYKFIIRYHRTCRKIKKFVHGKELTKIIRKIIKCQPRQGQQFGTHNLLVTYNQTSWTRQDKMFAMLKFKDRSGAAAFSYAFVLTIKVIGLLESSQLNTTHSVATSHSNQSLILSDKDSNNEHKSETRNDKIIENCLFNSSENDLPQKDMQYVTNEQVLESKNNNMQLNNALVHSTVELLKTTIETSSSSLFSEESTTTCVTNDKISNKILTEPKTSKSHVLKAKWSGKSKLRNRTTPLLLNRATNNAGKKCSVLDKLNRSDMKSERMLVNDECQTENTELPGNKDEILPDDRIINCTSTINDTVNDNTNNDGTMDSVNLPYQYFIEEDIEKAKTESLNCRAPSKRTRETDHSCNKDVQTSNDRKLSETNEKGKKLIAHAKEFTAEPEGPPIPKKKKYFECKMSRSSDITDLVMEGLMFTIRQDQDSVAVIEQKTKLEVDEVLENSEKAETKEGEKCLRNSSLLGLENLITMIELPKEVEKKPINNNARDSMKIKAFTNMYRFGSNSSLINTNFADSSKCVLINGKIGLKNIDFIDDEDEEEDIVPEALQNKVFQPEQIRSEKINTNRHTLDRDLLMDDSDIGEKAKRKTANTEDNRMFNNSADTKSECNHSDKPLSNVPRIVSNRIITVDQIPLPLQRALRDKLVQQQFSVHRNTTEVHDKVVASGTQVKPQAMNCDRLGNIQTLTHSDNLGCNRNTFSKTLETDLQSNCNDISENDTIAKKEINKDNKKFKQSTPNNLQDITEEFYQNVPYMERKANSLDQRCFRHRQRSLDTFNTVKNDETRIEMLKLIQDITRGAKVVIRRMSTKSIRDIIGKSSSLATCIQ